MLAGSNYTQMLDMEKANAGHGKNMIYGPNYMLIT
jgi:hypothetical protein